jgi:hypothetical protein
MGLSKLFLTIAAAFVRQSATGSGNDDQVRGGIRMPNFQGLGFSRSVRLATNCAVNAPAIVPAAAPASALPKLELRPSQARCVSEPHAEPKMIKD